MSDRADSLAVCDDGLTADQRYTIAVHFGVYVNTDDTAVRSLSQGLRTLLALYLASAPAERARLRPDILGGLIREHAALCGITHEPLDTYRIASLPHE